MSAARPILPQVSNLVNDIRYIRAAGLRIPRDRASWMAQCVIGTRLRARVAVPGTRRVACTSGGRRAPAGRDGRYRESAHRSGRFGPIPANASPAITIPNGHARAGVPDRPEPPARAHFLACGSRAQHWRGFQRPSATPVAGAALALGRDIRRRFRGHHWRGSPYPGGWSIAPVAARPPPRISPPLRRRTPMQAPLLGGHAHRAQSGDAVRRPGARR